MSFRINYVDLRKSAFPLFALGMRFASLPTANLSYVFIAIYALRGRSSAIQALALSWLFSMLNPQLAPHASIANVGRFAVILTAALSVLISKPSVRINPKTKTFLFYTIFLGIFLLVHSYFFSPFFDVSALKAISWLVAMTTLIIAWSGLLPDERDDIVRQLFGGLVIVMLFSLPLLASPVGYLVRSTGFQGIFSHPQSFGTAMAVLGSWLAAQMFVKQQTSWLNVALVVCSLVLVVLSEARTGGLALVLGVAIGVFMVTVLSGRSIRKTLPGLNNIRVYIVLGVALMGALLSGPIFSERVDTYISKRGPTTSVIGAYKISRGTMIGMMWDNIKDKPIEGIGFGIASVPWLMSVTRDPVLGLPVSASIEKGVMPLAVLEELGVFGFLLVFGWVVMLLRQSFLGGLNPLAVILTALFLNMGEFTFFSPGGFGLLALILFGWASSGVDSKKGYR